MEYKSLREFKANLTAALDVAESGEKVSIERRGVRFLLVSEEAVKEARKQPTPENKKNNSEPQIIHTGEIGEYECCAAPAPCKHWVWDIQSGEGYINSLSGRVRSAEA